MKKLFAAIVIVFFLVGSASALTSALTVTYVGVSAFGGSYIATQAQIEPMSRADVVGVLSTPTKSYGYCDVWVKHDQIYIAYYDVFGNPVSVVILPPTSW